MRTRTWEISDEFWALVEPLLLPTTRRDSERGYKRKPGGGRKAKYSDRLYFSGIVYVPRTRIIWNAFAREKFEGLCSSALHGRFLQWARAGLFAAIWLMSIVSLSGCATNVTMTEKAHSPVAPSQVKILFKEKPKCNYEELAFISTPQKWNQNIAIEAAREKAAEIGADY